MVRQHRIRKKCNVESVDAERQNVPCGEIVVRHVEKAGSFRGSIDDVKHNARWRGTL
jgi:hypothetical protein